MDWTAFRKILKIIWPLIKQVVDALLAGDIVAADNAYAAMKAKVMPKVYAAEAAHAKARQKRK